MQDTSEQQPVNDSAEAANNNVNETAGAPTESEAEAPPAEVEVAALQTELTETKDQLLRALAETENVRRRAQRDREEAGKYAITAFARELVGVADNLRRAITAIPPEALANDEALKSLAAGVELTERQLLTAFER